MQIASGGYKIPTREYVEESIGGGKSPQANLRCALHQRAHQEMENIINGENVIYYVIFGRSELGLNQIQFASK